MPEKPRTNQPLLDSTPIPSFSAMGIPQTKREHGMAMDDAWRGEMWDAIIEWRQLAKWYAAMEGRR